MSTRLDRLLQLLDTAPSTAARSAAAYQIGELQAEVAGAASASRTHELQSLLERLNVYLRDTRYVSYMCMHACMFVCLYVCMDAYIVVVVY